MGVDAPEYLVVGSGRWAGVIGTVLSGMRRRVRVLSGTRRGNRETADSFGARLSNEMRDSGAAIAWICVPPCPELPQIVESAVTAGLHVIVEKPWLCSRATSERIAESARWRGVLVAVHFQFCFLDGVEALNCRAATLVAPCFSGVLPVSRSDRLRISALFNLGSHLIAIREYAVPGSRLTAIRCAYQSTDERFVRITTGAGEAESIQLQTDEPLIQRFVERFEGARHSMQFPLDLRFASRVLDVLNGCAT